MILKTLLIKNPLVTKQLSTVGTYLFETAVTYREYNIFRELAINQASNPKIHLIPSYKSVRYVSRSPQVFLQDDAKLVKKIQAEDWGDMLARWYKQYQDFVGISEILEAQEKVSNFTSQLTEVQIQRRNLQKDVENVHLELLSTQKRISKSELYSEDHYALFEKARELNSKLKLLQDQFSYKEDEERILFTQLSAAIKFCHEKEKIQSEQSKYWSILISVVSASLAALVTSINNWMRIREIKEHASILHSETMAKSEQLQSEVTNALKMNNQTLPLGLSGNTNSTNETIPNFQNTLKEEFDKLSSLIEKLSDNRIKEQDYEGDFNESKTLYQPNYVRILAAGVVGAAIGTVITVTFFAPTGGA